MRWRLSVVAFPVFLLSLMIGLGNLPRVSGQLVGVLCVSNNSSSPAPGCPSVPFTFTGAVGGTLAVTINIQGSDAFNGYAITVQTDPSVLQPIGVNLSGGLIPPPSPCLICPPPFTITGGTVHVAILQLSLTTAPTTGRLFNITYSVVGGGSTPIAFPTGCPGSSSNDSSCVLITNGTTTPVPENLLPAIFNAPGFSIGASSSSLTLSRGSSSTSTLTLNSLNGFASTVSLSTSISPTQNRNLDVSLNPASVALVAGRTGTSTLTVLTAKNTRIGTYAVTVTAVSGLTTRKLTITVNVTK